MKPQRLSVRFPATSPPEDLAPAIPVFHRFIQRGLVEGQLLDVADYRHVPQGPGVILIAHDVDYAVDTAGMTLVRKRSHEEAASQLRDLLRMGLGAQQAIAADGGLDVTFTASTFTVSALDRRLGTADEVSEQLRDAIAPVVAEVYGDGAEISAVASDDPRRPATVHVQAAPTTGEEVLRRLGGSQAPGQSPWDIAVEDLARLRDEEADLVLLDVREPSEVELVDLGGTPIPLASLEHRLDELDRDAHIVVHCKAGLRGAKAVRILRDAGFEDAWNLSGGLVAWSERIDPSLPQY